MKFFVYGIGPFQEQRYDMKWGFCCSIMINFAKKMYFLLFFRDDPSYLDFA